MPAPEENDFAKGNSGRPGAPKWNTRNLKHGAYVSRPQARRTFSDREHEVADALITGWIDHAPFGRDSALVERLEKTAVRSILEARALGEVLDQIEIEQVVGVSDDGEPVTRMGEHHLAKLSNRLSLDIRMNLKDLGCLPDPESANAAATASLTSALADSSAGESDESDEPIDVDADADTDGDGDSE